MRKQVLEDTVGILREGGFAVSDACNIRPKSFDVVARREREDLTLLVKALVNIDGLDGETAEEMKALARRLGGRSVVVGVKTRDRGLEDGVLYLRHGVPAMNRSTAYDYLVEGVPPLTYMGSGGLYVSIDGDLLADVRDDEDMSLGRVAEELGVSRRAVSKYEDGMDASLDVALALEDLFEEPLISSVEVWDRGDDDGDASEGRAKDLDDEDERRVFGMLRSAGFDVHTTERAPFRALSLSKDDPEGADDPGDETVLTGTSHHSSDVDKRARLMSSISDVTRTRSIYVVDSSSKDAIDDTVLIETDELGDLDDSEELDEVFKERAGS